MSVHQLYLAGNKWTRGTLKWLLEGELANDCKPGEQTMKGKIWKSWIKPSGIILIALSNQCDPTALL